MRALLCNCYAPLLAYLTKFLIGDYIFSVQCTTPLNELTVIFLVFKIFLPLIFADIYSFFIGHILLDSSNSNVPNTFSFFFHHLTIFFLFSGSANIPLEFFSLLTFFIKYFLKFLTFCLPYATLSRLPTAFIGDNPIKIALRTFLFILRSIYSGSVCSLSLATIMTTSCSTLPPKS